MTEYPATIEGAKDLLSEIIRLSEQRMSEGAGFTPIVANNEDVAALMGLFYRFKEILEENAELRDVVEPSYIQGFMDKILDDMNALKGARNDG